MRVSTYAFALLAFVLLSLQARAVAAQTGTPPPDDQILFISNASGSRVWSHLVNVDGTDFHYMGIYQDEHIITEIWDMACSPNSGIVFAASGLYKVDIDGTNLQAITFMGIFGEVALSPDGSRIAFMGLYIEANDLSGEIYLMNVDGSNIVRLTDNDYWDGEPSWSPDGLKIAFAYGDFGSRDIAVINADGSNRVQLTTGTADDRQPKWSPDGQRILFVSDRDGLDNLYTMNPDGSNITQLTEASGNNGYPVWSPDGNFIAFNSDRDGNGTNIYVMNADGSGVSRLTDNQHEITNRPQCWLSTALTPTESPTFTLTGTNTPAITPTAPP